MYFLFQFVFFLLLHTVLSDCPSGSVQSSNGNCYQLIFTPRTWYQAESDCVANGGHLASITNAFTNSYLLQLGDKFFNSNDYWIGGTSNFLGGNWSWSDYKPFGYTNWAFGYPNINAVGFCASQRLNDGLWMDGVCTQQKQYICEFMPNTTVTCPSCPDGWFYSSSSNKCYKGETLYLKWSAALKHCQTKYNATLPSIHSDIENLLVATFVTYTNSNPNYFWIGAYDPTNTGNTANFIWIDNSTMSYTNWNDRDNGCCNCAVLDASDATWWTENCNDNQDYAVICEKNAF